MNRDYYHEKISQILNDGSYYKCLPNNIDKTILTLIKKFCSKYRNILTPKELDFVTKFQSKTSNFYGLPKLHKSIEIQNAITAQNSEYIRILNPTDLTFRPIVAGPTCPTHRISNLIDILLQPFLSKINSYVKDNIHFLNMLPNDTCPDSLLATFDVTNLYSNIPHELGKKAITFWLEKYPETLNPRFNNNFIIDALDIILNKNTFQFNDKNYIQIIGTAMGTKTAPSYATLTLAFLEEKLYNTMENEYGQTTLQEFKQSWKRYLDDCFIIWKKSWGNIEKFHSILQNLHQNIKFTMEQHPYQIPFLDITIIKNQLGSISTDIYRKPTDTQLYLPYTSNHPRKCLQSIPYTLARRICTIVSDNNVKMIRLKELHATLLQRGYPYKLINQGFKLALEIPIQQLRDTKKKNKDNPIAFVCTYNKCNPNIFPIIKQNLDLLKDNEILKTTRIIKSNRQPRNLKQILTSAYFGNQCIEGVKKCGKTRCELCPLLLEGKTFIFENHNTPFKINRNLNCDSENVIYAMKCVKCSADYIGSTNNLRNRTNLHKSNINTAANRNLPVSKHMHTCGKSFRIMPIYQNADYKLLQMKEEIFIKKYCPKLNNS